MKKYTSLNIHQYVTYLYMLISIVFQCPICCSWVYGSWWGTWRTRTWCIWTGHHHWWRDIKLFQNILHYNLYLSKKLTKYTCTHVLYTTLPLFHNYLYSCITGRSSPGTRCIIWHHQRRCCPTWSCPGCIIRLD